MIFSGYTIDKIYYSGYTVTAAYSCGGYKVFGQETEYRWVNDPDKYWCSGITKYNVEKEQSSTDGGTTWTDTGNYRNGTTIIDTQSIDCGYIPSNKKLYVKIGQCGQITEAYYSINCNNSSTLTSTEVGNINCYSATKSAVVGSCVTVIGDYALNLPYLETVTLPSGLTTIGTDAFRSPKLKTITIPSGVTSIGNYAFESNVAMESITILATTPPTLGLEVFDNTNNCPIYVPAASVNAYKTASGWSAYASRIQAIPT